MATDLVRLMMNFPFLMLSAKQENYWYHFYKSLV